MVYGSVCSGIECATAAWRPLGWKAAFFSEVDPWCCDFLEQRYPGVPNLGDMTRVDWSEWAGRIDVFVGGTPCQAFSVAGLRNSLDDERGNLTLEFARAADILRPRLIVWENVPGVLTLRDNAFGCFLAALVGADAALEPVPFRSGSKWWHHSIRPCRWRWNELGGAWDVVGTRERKYPRWPRSGVVDGPRRSVAWRIQDAQYFRVAQRRERVFLVASPRGEAHPAEILFEREGVQRYFAPRREKGQGSTGAAENCVGVGGEWGGACGERG